MKVLIVGVGGALARLVALKLREAGHAVIGLDRRPWFDAPRDIQVHEVDIRKRAAEDVFRREFPQLVFLRERVLGHAEQCQELLL